MGAGAGAESGQLVGSRVMDTWSSLDNSLSFCICLKFSIPESNIRPYTSASEYALHVLLPLPGMLFPQTAT